MIKKKSAPAPAVKKAAKATSKTIPEPVSKAAKPSRKMAVAGVTARTAPASNRSAKPVAKATVKPTAKTASEPIARQAAVSVKPVAAKPTVAKSTTARAPATTGADGVSAGSLLDVRDRPRKPKLIRDSFTMPEAEYAALGEVKKACLKAGYEVKKSELLRVGVSLIRKMDIVHLKDILAALPPLKAGRPKKS